MRPGPCPHARGCDDKSVWPEYHRLRGVGAGPVPWRLQRCKHAADVAKRPE